MPAETGRGSRLSFTWLAFVVAGSLLAIQTGFQLFPPSGGNPMPLLTQMVITEFGFLLSLIGAGAGIYHFKGEGATVNRLVAIVLCTACACGYLWIGMPLWKAVFGY